MSILQEGLQKADFYNRQLVAEVRNFKSNQMEMPSLPRQGHSQASASTEELQAERDYRAIWKKHVHKLHTEMLLWRRLGEEEKMKAAGLKPTVDMSAIYGTTPSQNHKLPQRFAMVQNPLTADASVSTKMEAKLAATPRRDSFKELESKIHQLTDDKNKCEAENSRLKAAVEKATHEVGKILIKNNELKKKLCERTATRPSVDLELEATLNTLREDNNLKAARLAETETLLEQSRIRIEEHEVQKQEGRGSFNQVELLVQRCEGLKRKMREAEELASAQIQQLNCLLQKSDEERKSLQVALADKDLETVTENLNSTVKELKTANGRLLEINAKLQGEVVSSQEAMKLALTKQEEKISLLEQNLRRLESENKALAADKNMLEQQEGLIQEKRDAEAMKLIQDFQTKVVEKENQIVIQSQKLKQTEAIVKKLTSDLEKREEAVRAVTATAESKATEWSNYCKKLESEKEQQQNEKNQAEEEHRSLQEQCDRIRSQLEDAATSTLSEDQRIGLLQDDKNRLEKNLKKLCETLEQKKIEEINHQKESAEQHKKITELLDTKRQLEEQINEFQQKLKFLEQKGDEITEKERLAQLEIGQLNAKLKTQEKRDAEAVQLIPELQTMVAEKESQIVIRNQELKQTAIIKKLNSDLEQQEEVVRAVTATAEFKATEWSNYCKKLESEKEQQQNEENSTSSATIMKVYKPITSIPSMLFLLFARQASSRNVLPPKPLLTSMPSLMRSFTIR